MTPLPTGTQLDGRYEVLGVLGEGGMATVYKVRHVGLHSVHALKALAPELSLHEEVRARFLAEGRIQAKLRHPNIVQVTEIVTSPVAGLVMEYVEGPTLADHFRRHGAARDTAEAVGMFLQVLDGVEEAHRAGVVHRDLKPENILLGRDSRGRLQPRVTDFGIAHVAEQGTRKTRAGTRMGTPQYMSPEHVRGAEGVDARSDIFSLGAILYEWLTGQRAFEGKSDFDVMAAIVGGQYRPVREVAPWVGPALAACIERALQTDPALRHGSCAAFRAALEEAALPIAPIVPVASASPVEVPPAPRSVREGPVLSEWGFLGLFLFGVLLLVWVIWMLSATGPAAVVPGKMVPISGGDGIAPFALDQSEVTVDAYVACVQARQCTEPGTGPLCNWSAQGKGQHPVNCVDWSQAADFCRFQQKRLPTGAEWAWAASNGGRTKFPWGSSEPSQALAQWRSEEGTAPVGSHPLGATENGLHDLAGNVWEWTDTSVSGEKMLAGGSWGQVEPTSLEASGRLWIHPSYRLEFYGFRCAR